MSKFVFYLKLEPYLKQWLVNSLGSPVQFPAQSNENAVIRSFLQRRPADKAPELADDDLTAICIPDSKAKPPVSYNYLGQSAKYAIKETIEDLFRRNMWNELNDLTKRPCCLTSVIAAWCELHGISEEHEETIRQKFYRMRTAYTEKGINLGFLTRKRTDE